MSDHRQAFVEVIYFSPGNLHVALIDFDLATQTATLEQAFHFGVIMTLGALVENPDLFGREGDRNTKFLEEIPSPHGASSIISVQ